MSSGKKKDSIYKRLLRCFSPSFFVISDRIKNGYYWWKCGGYYTPSDNNWKIRQRETLRLFRRELEFLYDMEEHICADEIWDMSLSYKKNGVASLTKTLREYHSNVIFVNMIV
jgi:hypothetical protein